MARIFDPALVALMSIVYRRLGEGIPPVSAPALCRTWKEDFQDTLALPDVKPIMSQYTAHPFRGKTPNFGKDSYPMFAMWRDTSDWINYSNDVDQNTSVFSFMWVMPPDKETERIWPLLQAFVSNMRRVFENAPEDPDDSKLILFNASPHNDPHKMALISEYAVEIKSRFVYQSANNTSDTLYPTLTGAFSIKQNWERDVFNLGLDLERFREAACNYLLKDPRNDGDWTPSINPILESLGLPLQP